MYRLLLIAATLTFALAARECYLSTGSALCQGRVLCPAPLEVRLNDGYCVCGNRVF